MTERYFIEPGYNPTTGLPDGIALSEALAEAEELAPAGFAVVECDADGLKAENDMNGHLAGDEMLRQIGAQLRQGSVEPGRERAADQVFHKHGDEFTIILPIDDSQKLGIAIRRIQSSLDQQGLRVAMGGQIHDPAKSIDEMLNGADEAMRKNKLTRLLERLSEKQIAAIRMIGQQLAEHSIDPRTLGNALDALNDQNRSD